MGASCAGRGTLLILEKFNWKHLCNLGGLPFPPFN